MVYFLALTSVLALTACNTSTSPIRDPQATWLSESEKADLNILRPYPNYDDVCALLGPRKNTASLRKPGHDLIACPKYEKGATSQRQQNGAIVVGESQYWVVLRVSSDLVEQQMQTYKQIESAADNSQVLSEV